MRVQKHFNNRYNIFYYIMLALLILLVFRLAVLTIVEGEEHRYNSDTKRVKNIPVKAPRGNIYDKNGKVLAENISSFTVQILKDEISKDEFNDTAFTLSKILDSNGEKLIDEFPIVLNTFNYITNNTSDISAQEEIINIIINNQLMGDLFTYDNYIKERAFLVLNKEIEKLTIQYSDGIFEYALSAETNEDWILENRDNAENEAISLITQEKKYIRKLISNSNVRFLVYNFLREKGLADNIELIPYSFSFDDELRELKESLMESSDKITMTSTAKSDFINLNMMYSVDELLTSKYISSDAIVLPGVIIYDELIEIIPNLPVIYTVVDEFVKFEYKDESEVNEFLNQLNNGQLDYLNIKEDITALELVKGLAEESGILYDTITSEEVKYFAQTTLLSYVNPSISVKKWKYRSELEKEEWIEYNINKEDISDADEVFNSLREKTNINEEISDYDARNVFLIRERYIKQGYLAFYPIDICYGAEEKTVAMISERSNELGGVNVEIEPLRNYPMGDSAAHVIGYLGKISQPFEIEEYINKENYSPDDIIGKAGIEEKFESLLKGIKGEKTVEIDSLGNTIKTVSEVEPTPGNNIYLTIDSDLQRTAEEALEKALKQIQIGGTFESKWGDFNYEDAYKEATSGALVALDVNTGEVLALVNFPSYDLNLFSTGISKEDWEGLLNDSKNPLAPRPLYNISLLTAIQPGSTFKMITALAALEKGIPPEEEVYCAGHMEIGTQTFGCWIWNIYGYQHGYQNVYQAIENSCNFYFYSVVLGENQVTHEKTSKKVEIEDMLYLANEFGLNERTGIEIDIPREKSGGVPNPQNKKIIIKYNLRNFLDENIEIFLDENVQLDDEGKEKIIDEIVSWADLENAMSRGEVYRRLLELNINPDKKNEIEIPFVDLIKYSYLNQAAWNSGDTMNISIGQGTNSYTPIQMANYIATIANGGYRHNVSIIKSGLSFDGQTKVYEPERSSTKINLNNYENLEHIKIGMNLVAESSKIYKTFPVGVGAKTGTAEKDGINPETGEPYDDYAWYVAFAPYDEPQIAVAAVIFQGGSGRYPSPVVREVIGEYLNLEPIVESE